MAIELIRNFFPKMFGYLVNRENTGIRTFFYFLSVGFFLACFGFCLAHTFETHPQKVHHSGFLWAGVFVGVYGGLLAVLQRKAKTHVIEGNFSLISAGNGKLCDYAGPVLAVLVGWLFNDKIAIPISRQLLTSISCLVFGIFFLQITISPMNTGFGLLDSTIGVLMVFLYRDFKYREFKSWTREAFLLFGCVVSIVFKACYDRFLVIRSEAAIRATLEAARQQVTDLTAQLGDATITAANEAQRATDAMNAAANEVQRVNDAMNAAAEAQQRVTSLTDQLRDARNMASDAQQQVTNLTAQLSDAKNETQSMMDDFEHELQEVRLMAEGLNALAEGAVADCKDELETAGQQVKNLRDDLLEDFEAVWEFGLVAAIECNILRALSQNL